MKLQRVLRRQLEHLGLAEDAPPTADAWRALLQRVDQTYAQMRDRHRDLMSAILDSMVEGVVAADAAHGYTLVNPAAEDILGPATHWPAVDDWPGRGESGVLARAIGGELLLDRRIVIGAEGGPTRHLSLSAIPLPAGTTADGHGAVAVFRDVTELVELDRFKTEMTSLVVHDLKNVLMVIGASIEYATEIAGDRSEELLEALGGARDAGSRATRLIANLMDVARLENRRLELRPTAIEPAALCQLAIRHRTGQLKAAGIGLAIGAEAVAPIRGDIDVLQRVLDNVLDNAVRYTPHGGRIAITAASDPVGRVQIRVGNSGPAVPDADRTRIFDKYGQSDESGTRMNAGLGLYFCRLAIAAHGGRIWYEQTPDLPAVFVIELPPYDAPPVSSPSDDPPPRRRRRTTGSALGE